MHRMGSCQHVRRIPDDDGKRYIEPPVRPRRKVPAGTSALLRRLTSNVAALLVVAAHL